MTDAGLAAATDSFEWTFTELVGTPSTQTTAQGEVSYTPRSAGEVTLVVRLLGAGNTEQATLSLTQAIVLPNAALETLINAAVNQPGPGVSNPDATRELINDHNPYYQNVALETAEAGDGFRRFVFGVVLDGALRSTAADRKRHLENGMAIEVAKYQFQSEHLGGD